MATLSGETWVQFAAAQAAVPVGGGHRMVLHDLNVVLHRGEWVALVGRNGSGKSTLAKLAAGLTAPAAGRVAIRPEAQPIHMVFQNPDSQFIGDTIYEDLRFGMENRQIDPSRMRETAQHALARVGLERGMDTSVFALSGGQKQLLAIAGCLAASASVLVLDEVTSMLDPHARLQIMEVLCQLHRDGVALLMATQFMEEVTCAQRVVALNNGRLVFDGGPAEFFYGRQSEAEPSWCRKLGFEPPYAVRVTEALAAQGVHLQAKPLTPESFTEAVRRL